MIGPGDVIEPLMTPGSFVVADGLPLERLYARFNAMARGLIKGDSSAAHRSVIDRLASNQRRAEALDDAFGLDHSVSFRAGWPSGWKSSFISVQARRSSR